VRASALTADLFQSVEDYLRNGGSITLCPTAYAASTPQGALDDDEAALRLRRMKLPPDPERWQNNAMFAGSKP
jgi:hypothetical protein